MYGVLRCCSAFGFAANLLLVNDCAKLVEGSHLGAVNAYSTMASCIARAAGPAVLTTLFSLTVSSSSGSAKFFHGWLVWTVLFVAGAAGAWSTGFVKPIEIAVEEEEARRKLRQRRGRGQGQEEGR